ncbi:MAG: hypothetical protein ACT4RN_16975 [Pseudonocardia sp.]
MEHLLMCYRVKADELERHLQLLRAVFADLHATDPGDLAFISYQLDDPQEFIELASASQLPGPLPQMESFRRYRANLEDRCESRSAEALCPIGSYRS